MEPPTRRGLCTVLGAAVALFSGRIAEGVALPALRLVMVANILAALAVGFASATAATLLTVLPVVTVAIDIALFATSQAVALRALPARG